MQAPGVRVEVWFQDEARIGQKNSLTRVWGQTGSRPVAPKDLGFASAYLFGAVCPSRGKAAALIMPICNTAGMNHHLCEISSQVAADAHAVVILDGAGWHRSQGLVVPGNITLLELPPPACAGAGCTARSSTRSSGFGIICAAIGSPTRCFPAWRTSWMPARWPGTDLPTTTAWSARYAQSLGPRLRPLYSCCLLSSRGLRLKHTHVRKYPESRISI